ncbi:MAG: hypothetical protein K0S47_3078 [Herbinix sp.]|nr:hypothetical protein [Herbinix sp.]
MSLFSENIRQARKTRGYTQKDIAEIIQLSNSTYCLYESGEREPSLATVEKLAQTFGVTVDELLGIKRNESNQLLKENSTTYLTKQRFSCDGFFGVEGIYAELFRGYVVPLTILHRQEQELVSELFYELKNYIKNKKLQYHVYAAPFPVVLSEKDAIVVRPDITIIRKGMKFEDHGYYGVPDFIIEIIKPSDKTRDSIEKLKLYADYGVTEYWIIDPERQRIAVYQLKDNNPIPQVYGYHQKVKANLFPGLELCLRDINTIDKDYI